MSEAEQATEPAAGALGSAPRSHLAEQTPDDGGGPWPTSSAVAEPSRAEPSDKASDKAGKTITAPAGKAVSRHRAGYPARRPRPAASSERTQPARRSMACRDAVPASVV